MLLDAERLTTLIRAKYKSRAEFAAACGLSRQAVHQFITGKINPSLPTLVRLAEGLDVAPGDLLRETGKRESREVS